MTREAGRDRSSRPVCREYESTKSAIGDFAQASANHTTTCASPWQVKWWIAFFDLIGFDPYPSYIIKTLNCQTLKIKKRNPSHCRPAINPHDSEVGLSKNPKTQWRVDIPYHLLGTRSRQPRTTVTRGRAVTPHRGQWCIRKARRVGPSGGE